MTELREGAVLGNYRVDWLIGRGGMGSVYLAQHVRMANRKAALKVLSRELAADPDFRERFIRESDLAGALEHPNIVPVYDAGESEGVLYSVMRYVRGRDLGALLEADGRLSAARTYAIVSAVGKALDFAHAHGLLHRDVKPGNVMLEPRRSQGGRERVFLTDFGLVKRLKSGTKLTRTGYLVGTLDYTAPEVFRGDEADGRADLYSLGCVLYECLTGSVPFPEATDAAVMYAHLQQEPPRVTAARPDLPAGVDAVVATALAKRPDDRFPTCADLVQALREVLAPAERTVVPIDDRTALVIGGRVETAAAAEQEATAAGPGTTIATQPPPLKVVPITTRPAPKELEPPPPPEIRRAPLRRVRSRRWPRVAVAVLLLLALVAATLRLTLGGGAAGVAFPAVEARVGVGARPLAVAFGRGAAWVANAGDGTISRVDAETNRVVATIRTGGEPQGIAFGFDSVWVADADGDQVVRIDPATNQVTATIPVGNTPVAVVAEGGSVWVVDAASNSVSRVDPGSSRVVDTIRVGAGPVSAVFALGRVWVANVGDNTVSKLSLLSGRVTRTIPVPTGVAGIAFGRGALWVTNDGGRHGFVARIDPQADVVTDVIEVGPSPFGVAFGEGAVWVAQTFEGTVAQIDPKARRIEAAVPVGGGPAAVTFGGDAVWVTNGDGTVSRIHP